MEKPKAGSMHQLQLAASCLVFPFKIKKGGKGKDKKIRNRVPIVK